MTVQYGDNFMTHGKFTDGWKDSKEGGRMLTVMRRAFWAATYYDAFKFRSRSIIVPGTT